MRQCGVLHKKTSPQSKKNYSERSRHQSTSIHLILFLYTSTNSIQARPAFSYTHRIERAMACSSTELSTDRVVTHVMDSRKERVFVEVSEQAPEHLPVRPSSTESSLALN